MRFASLALVAAALVFTGSSAAHADSLAYQNVGTPAPLVNLTATSTGPIIGYFMSSNAMDTDYIALVDLTSGTYSSLMMNNHQTTPGTAVNFGNVTKGDQLLFVLYNQTTDTLLTSSNYNYDGLTHAYITNYAGGVVNGVTYPTGVYVGFEDLLKSQQYSDFDYNDNTFVFTNVAASPVPEPGTLALMGTGMVGLAGAVRRRFAQR